MNSAPKLSCYNKKNRLQGNTTGTSKWCKLWSTADVKLILKNVLKGEKHWIVWLRKKTRRRTLNVHFNNQIVICNSSVIMITFEMKDLYYYKWIILQGGTKYWQFISFFCNVFEQLLIVVLYCQVDLLFSRSFAWCLLL